MKQIPTYALYGEAPRPAWHRSLHVESISRRSGSHEWVISPHRHDLLLQLLYLQQGSGLVQYDGQCESVRAPALIYIPAHCVHGFRWDGAVEGRVITALQHPLEHLATSLAPNVSRWMQATHLIAAPAWTPAEDPLSALLAALEEEYHGRAAEHDACSLGLLLGLVIRLYRLEDEARPHPPGDRRSEQLRQFRELVEKGFRQHLQVGRYAQELGMTPVTLGRLCQDQLGMTALQLINSRLLLEAQRELAYSTRSIKEIALELGFSDEAYFSRFIRKQTKLAPSEFRQQARSLQPARPAQPQRLPSME